jgi:hypothetical protein
VIRALWSFSSHTILQQLQIRNDLFSPEADIKVGDRITVSRHPNNAMEVRGRECKCRQRRRNITNLRKGVVKINEVPSVPNKSSDVAFITKRGVPDDVANTKQRQDTSFAKFRLAFEHTGVRQPISLRGWYKHAKQGRTP